jgi:Sugar (and other) transporter
MLFSWIFSFSVFQLRTVLIDWLGSGGQMFFFAFSSVLGTLFAMFFLPETAGKSSEEISSIMNK